MDGHTCIPIPTTTTTTTTTTTNPLRGGLVVTMHNALAPRTPWNWLSFTATNDEPVQRWYHYMRIGYGGSSAMRLRLVGPNTFKMQNVYGHGYAPYWVGFKDADGEVRASYGYGEAVPFKFVKVGCNMYKLQNMWPGGRYKGMYVDNHHSHWLTVRGTFATAAVFSVWKIGETVDECGHAAPTSLMEEAVKGTPLAWATIFTLFACVASLVTFGMVLLRRRIRVSHQLAEGLLDEDDMSSSQ